MIKKRHFVKIFVKYFAGNSVKILRSFVVFQRVNRFKYFLRCDRFEGE